MSFQAKTRAEQKLDHLQSLDRPLSAAEKAEIDRCIHAIYMREWRYRKASEEVRTIPLIQARREELETLDKVLAEAGQ